MSRDMTLLILTHLRAGLERKDWRAVERAYALAGGVGAGAPAKRPGDPEKARDEGCGGEVVPPDALKRARGSAAAPDGWLTLGNVR